MFRQELKDSFSITQYFFLVKEEIECFSFILKASDFIMSYSINPSVSKAAAA